ncbi:MAG: hypothetical protein AAF696_06015 [Bacteroidota bacterium]
MDPFNNNDIDSLRSTDLMIAYLQDRAGEEESQKIEALMESDPLYQLSMEELAAQLGEHGIEHTKANILQTASNFDEALEAAKKNFISQQESPLSTSDQGSIPGPAIPRWSLYIAILLIGAMTWFFLSQQTKTELHKSPTENLQILVDEKLQLSFLDGCDGGAIGRQSGPSISISSALLESFAGEKFELAAEQFGLLGRNPKFSEDCKNLSLFYQGQSLVALKKWEEAGDIFEKLAGQVGVEIKLQNAAIWYLANIKLLQGESAKARSLFERLKQSKNNSEAHITSLWEANYLIDAEKYLSYLDG